MARHIHISRPRMSFAAACELVDEDLPDGAFWAMAHEMAGLEYGEGFDELLCEEQEVLIEVPADRPEKKHPCRKCGKRFVAYMSARQHERQKHKMVT